MTARHQFVLALATLALALPPTSVTQNRDWKRDQKQQQKQERREERREIHQQQNQNNQQNSHPAPTRVPPVPGSNVPALPLNGPGPHAGDWLRRMTNLPPQEQQKELESDPNFKRLTPDQQQRLRQRLNWFSSRAPDQQQRILNGMEFREHLTPEQKMQERQLFQRYQGLPVDRRRAVHNGLVSLLALPPEQRQQALSSPEYRARFNDPEREMLGRALEFGTSPNQMRPNPD
jgi:hypothetical protein